jgi:hypothetical protein
MEGGRGKADHPGKRCEKILSASRRKERSDSTPRSSQLLEQSEGYDL